MSARYINDLAAPIYYVAGPSPIVKAMRGILNGIGTKNEDIRTEKFAGY